MSEIPPIPDETRSTQGTWLIVIISALLCLGGLMVFSAGSGLDQKIEFNRFWEYSTMRRVALIPVVWLVLALVSKLDYRRCLVHEKHFWFSPLIILTAVSVLLLVAVLIPGIGTAVNESRRWIKIGPITIQPSELAKWTTVMFLAAYCWKWQDHIRDFRKGFLPACLFLGLVVALIGKEDFGTAALVGVVGTAVLFAGGVRWWHLLILIPLAAIAFYLLVYCDAHRWGRVLAFLYGDQSGTDMPSAYHARQSIMAIGAGGFWGVGLGRGTIKQGWLPEDTTDFIFAVICEELGFFGAALIIGLFILMMFCCMRIIHQTQNNLARLLAIAISTMIGTQAVMNLAVVTALAPTKGIALPFVSAGGSGLLMTALAAGVLINIARQKPNT